MTEPIQALLLGAGSRGYDVFARWALQHPDQLKFVAVADPDPAKRQRMMEEHGIPASQAFANWQDALNANLPIQAVVNALPDHLHEESATKVMQKGYHQLLEKPITNNLSGAVRIAEAAEASGKVLMLAYVLRYTPFFSTIHDVVQSGQLGEVVHFEWSENVSAIHYSHSFVRGNWSNTAKSSPMILAKCSHDLDQLAWILPKRIKQLSSFGSLLHYREENKPAGAPKRCLDGCPVAETCSFHAAKIYLTDYVSWPVNVISTDMSLEGRIQALQEGPYGVCVYQSDNDVVDNQVVMFELVGGGSGTLAMHGHSGEEGRYVRIDGTKATLTAAFTDRKQEIWLEPHTFETSYLTGGHQIPIQAPSGTAGMGHGGGDDGVCQAFVQSVRNGTIEPTSQYLESQYLAFAIEEARHQNTKVDMEDFRGRASVGALV
ncbi:Gfo/Idh/MocA family protein [Deinococcus cellulosilyticus]|uniref:Oxidoreductase n=1 Tax=Deinococcus cellulosilyticus (strain DSM 18568 / NBRC 106333 / KACC 11606 / 5516J-15) TaxID=1223518 RepID=A0A511N8Y3_DEIC1|nr:Gfo/Idh/MocA family oxidoreductase [Deinococcus cellulosilyticus]GEM49313.1 oxidoreductase [Deinococcus cellulosilyticus NBRC 106333 = KACC 11606]